MAIFLPCPLSSILKLLNNTATELPVEVGSLWAITLHLEAGVRRNTPHLGLIFQHPVTQTSNPIGGWLCGHEIKGGSFQVISKIQ